MRGKLGFTEQEEIEKKDIKKIDIKKIDIEKTDIGKEDARKRSPGLAKKALFLFLLISLSLFLCACGKQTKMEFAGFYYHGDSDSEEASEESQEASDYMLLVSMDTVNETIVVHSYANDRNYEYHTGLTTRFLNKYGDLTAQTNFSSGTVVELGAVDSNGILTELRMSDQVWVYEDVVRFSFDTSRSLIKIADSNYAYDDSLYVFSNGERTSLGAITEDDTLTIVGDGKKILSVDITTGHGTLSLVNTDLFEDSLLQLDNRIFVKITPSMTMELPEGTYTLTVANDGWGGSQEITITRGETTEVDLDAIKGEGPKYGQILFVVDNVEAQIYVDNSLVSDITEPISLKYGYHRISVAVDGESVWSKILYVNSSSATIEISTDTTEDSESSDSSSTSSSDSSTNSSDSGTSTDSSTSSGTSSGTTSQNSDTSTSSSTSSTTDDDTLTDYLTTLSEMLSSLQ